MPVPSRRRYLLLPLLAVALLALVRLGLLLFREALSVGAGEAVLAAWVLAFVVALPALLAALALARGLRQAVAHHRAVPPMGVKIP